MLYGSARTKFLVRLFLGVAFAILGVALHQVVTFAVGLLVLAVAAHGWYTRD